MANVMTDTRVPLSMRVALSNAGLLVASTMVEGTKDELDNATFILHQIVEDVRICLRAAELVTE